MLGVGIALVFLIGFALIATQLLQIIGLLFAGGLLLLWVAWKMFRELRPPQRRRRPTIPTRRRSKARRATKTFCQAAIQVTLADLSMSLDNVLAVAGDGARASRGAVHRPGAVGDADGPRRQSRRAADRALSAGSPISAWCVILYVAGKMIYEGFIDPAGRASGGCSAGC